MSQEDDTKHRTETPSSQCTLKVRLTYPGKPTLAIVTSRPDGNKAVTYQRLDDNGDPIPGAVGAAKIPIL